MSKEVGLTRFFASKEVGQITRLCLRTLGQLIFIFLMVPAINHKQSVVAYDLANNIDPNVNCPVQPGRTLDIIFGAGSKKLPDGTYGPNIIEEARIEAEVKRITDDPKMLENTTIFLADGPLEDPNMDKRFLRNKVLKMSEGKINVQNSLIIPDPNGFNTTMGADDAVRFMADQGIPNATIITSRKHLDRAWFSLYVRGVCAKKVAAEDVLDTSDPEYQQLQEFNQSPLGIRSSEKERKEMQLLIIDQYGIIPTALNWLFNSR